MDKKKVTITVNTETVSTLDFLVSENSFKTDKGQIISNTRSKFIEYLINKEYKEKFTDID